MVPCSNPLSVSDPAPDGAAGQVRILVIGDVTRWKTLGRLQDRLDDCEFVELSDLHDQKIRQIAPDLVLSPLMTAAFDVIDVAERLRAVAFAGRYCAVANDLPDADLIRREVHSVAPELAFDVIILPPLIGANSG